MCNVARALIALMLLAFATQTSAAPAPLPRHAPRPAKHDPHPAWLVGEWRLTIEAVVSWGGWVGRSYSVTLAGCGRASAEERRDGRWDYLPGGTLAITTCEDEGPVTYEAKAVVDHGGGFRGVLVDPRACGMSADHEWVLRLDRER